MCLTHEERSKRGGIWDDPHSSLGRKVKGVDSVRSTGVLFFLTEGRLEFCQDIPRI